MHRSICLKPVPPLFLTSFQCKFVFIIGTIKKTFNFEKSESIILRWNLKNYGLIISGLYSNDKGSLKIVIVRKAIFSTDTNSGKLLIDEILFLLSNFLNINLRYFTLLIEVKSNAALNCFFLYVIKSDEFRDRQHLITKTE